MADKQISDLTSASALTDGSLFVIEQGGAAKNANWGMMKNYISPGVADQYSSSSTYNVGDYVIYNGSLYRCTTAITTAEAWTAGHWTAAVLSDDVSGLNDYLNQLYSDVPISDIFSDDLEAGYYSSVNGTKQNSNSFLRTRHLYRIDGGFYYYSVPGVQVRACLFDKGFNFIGHIYINSIEGNQFTFAPTNAVYCGLFISASSDISSYIHIRKFDSAEVTLCEYPFQSEKYSFIPNYYINGNGTIVSAQNLSLILLFNVKAGDRYYVSNDASYQGVCKDSSGNILTAAKENVLPYGQIITVPNGTAFIGFNIYNADTEGTSENLSNYVAKLTKDETILCIGDSLTWLDGRGTYGGAAHLNGYQSVIRKNGYDVRSAGYSGYPYTEGIHDEGSTKYSIYNEIVAKEYDVSGYDIIILFGGLNDMLYGAPLGNRPTTYSNRVFDTETFNGALGGIINYIRENNPEAQLLLCTPTKSEALSRIWTTAESFNNEIAYNSKFWSCYLNDVNTKLNVQPTYGQFDNFFYDPTHPNSKGMERVGKLMLLAVEDNT